MKKAIKIVLGVLILFVVVRSRRVAGRSFYFLKADVTSRLATFIRKHLTAHIVPPMPLAIEALLKSA